MSDPSQSGTSANTQKVIQQILLQYAHLNPQSQQQSPQNIVLSVPVGTPRTLPRLSLTPSAATAVSPNIAGGVSPSVAIVSGSTSPISLQAQAVAGVAQQQGQSYVQVSPSSFAGTQHAPIVVSSAQMVQNITASAPPNVYMVAGGQHTTLQQLAHSKPTFSSRQSVPVVQSATSPVVIKGGVLRHTTGQSSPRSKLSVSERKSPVAKVAAHAPSPKISTGARASPSHSNSIVAKKTETMQQNPTDVSQLSQEQIGGMRNEILKQRRGILRKINAAYMERLTESFFLQRGGNMMDYLAWKKKVPNATLESYLTKHKLEEKPSRYSNLSSEMTQGTTPARRKSENESIGRHSFSSGTSEGDGTRKRTHHKAGLDAFDFNDDMEGGPPLVKMQNSQTVSSKGSPLPQGQHLKLPSGIRQKDAKSPPPGITSTPLSVVSATPSRRVIPPGAIPKQNKSPLSPGSRDRLPTRQQSLSAVYDYSIGSQEMIVERAKQEAQVMQRIAELRKEGLWSAKRLPKVQEPPRYKTHWDYLLDEMQWLAADFSQERRWKKAAARKLARAVAAYHRDKQAKEIKAERDEANKLRRIASNIAKEVKQFWVNIEKVVQYKQQSRLEEKRKKALDMQLDFIVGQTEKYSSWLSEGLNLSEKGSVQGSVQGSHSASPETSDVEQTDEEFRPIGNDSDFVVYIVDEEFRPIGNDSDDEETIDVEEKEAEQDEETNELEMLQKESKEPIEEILSKLPPQALEEETATDGEKSKEEEADLKAVLSDTEEATKEDTSKDEEFLVSADETDNEVVDEEDTIEEEENLAGEADHKEELSDLKAESELPMEELLKQYAGAYDEEFEMPQSPEEWDMDSDDSEDDVSSSSEEEVADDEDEDGELKDVGMEYLLHPEKEEEQTETKPKTEDGDAGPNQEITDIAKKAESLQPKGYTLSETQVTTKVPPLLKHKLREYQHIGLDWLVTIHDKKLNGILADEMGLGKTIQTIALLAHLACDKGNWGPHLIVVPTSVMLNWEMEFKKWCPGFKILTYFGSQKERKQKRQGWTKQNAFHICITSYKLVIQDHTSFRRKKWKYLVLDEAQNIKNFKSQRWQTLLNFNSQRRLLLTGTPLQNNLMELWSLMHFLMPHVFQSHREFREWFSNPLSGMIEGTQEYNEKLIKRLHKVLRPFLLRRLKSQVEKQLPQKYEHVVKCRLSKRQRFLYDDFMGRTKTKETLKTGQFLSVINVLMQLRKVCNHPDLFEMRPSISPFVMEGINYRTASEVTKALDYQPLKHVNLANFNLCLADLELTLPAYIAHRTRQLQTPRKLIEEIDSIPKPPPRPPKMKMKPGKLLTPPGVAHVQREKLPMGRSSPSLSQQTHGRASPLRAASPTSRTVLRAASPHLQGRSSPGVTQVILRSPAGTPVPRQTTILPHGLFAGGATHQAIIPSLTGGTFALVSNPNNPGTFTIVQHNAGVPSATPLQQLPGYMATSMGPLSQQRLIQQQQQRLLNQGLQMRQQLVGRQPVTVQIQQNQVTAAAAAPRIASPLSQLGQISRGGVIQLIQQSAGGGGVPLVNSTPPISQVPPSPHPPPQTVQPQIRPTTQSFVQLLQQQQQQQQQQSAQMYRPRPQTVQDQLKLATQMVTGVTPVTQQPVIRPQNKVSAASPPVTARVPLPVVAPQVVKEQPKPAAAAPPQQLVQRTVQVQGVRTVSTVAPIQISTTARPPQTIIPSSTVTVVSSSQTPPKPGTGILAAMEDKRIVSTATVKTKETAVDTKPETVRQLTARELYQKEAAEAEKKETEKRKSSTFFMQLLEAKRIREHKMTLNRIARVNFRRCCAKPIYGDDLYSVVSIHSTARPATKGNDFSTGAGSVHCHCCLMGTGSVRLNSTYNHSKYLRQLLHVPTDYLEELKEIIDRYAFVIPKVTSPGISFSTFHPSPAAVVVHERLKSSLADQLQDSLLCLHPVESKMKIQFPELRLIQYDCGKLQALDMLLKKLKAGAHRILIFTQMAKMLDVLERFLNFHGHIYLRLDGATKVENRQILMERFNADKRIFCFILSTRSGGIGVNLTGADTVIFYDSDWNPTMDAQAQDRCHRIGQTRDVHIYRLISDMTVEENIIKKANQKRLLADVSIDGGNFTTAFFRKTAITDLFNMTTKEAPQAALPQPTPKQETSKAEAVVAATVKEEKGPVEFSQTDLEQALAKAEDESDVKAATMAHAEQDAELAEFDESIPYEGEEKDGEEGSKVEMELAQLDSQLTPIEKYAVKYMETTLEPITSEQLKEAEELIEEAKKEWELGCLQVMTTEAERQAEMEEDDIFFTYDRADATNKIYISQVEEIMPIWAPPTPPQDDNDVYIDHSMMLMYEQTTMTESQLPPVYIKREPKRIKVEHFRKIKSHKPEQPHSQTQSVMTPPQSLFNRPSAALLRMRRELAKQQQIRAMAGKPIVKPFVQRPSVVDAHVQDKPEWLINEDWALLQAIQTLQELPLALQPLIPGHTINWDLVSDIVNSCSRIYRSPKQCKIRYENVIIPREEGKILYDNNPKKQKKNKSIYRTKSNRPMKTGQLHAQDSNSTHSSLFNSKFDGMKGATAKRTPFCKQVLNNPLLKNPKHSAVLNEMNISYDKPMTPSQVALKRAERIAKEKKQQQEQQQQRQQAAAAAKAQQQQQQQQQQKQAQKAVVQPVGTGTTATVMQGAAIARGTIPKVVPAIRGTTGGSIVVNTSSTGTGGVTFATINKRMTQQLTPVVSATTGITAQTVGTLAQVVRSQGGRTTIPVTAIITTQTGRTTAGQIVSSVYTTSAQQPRAATAQTVTSTPFKNMGTVQIAFLRQQHQQQQQLKLERAKLQQQAQAQAQAVQAQAQAQAQAAQQQVQLQALTKVVSPSVSSSGTTITQQQLSALQQQKLAQKLRSPEMQALLKQQAHLRAVKGLTVSSVSSVASQAPTQIKQQAVTVAAQPGTLKTLTLPQGTTVSGAGGAGTTSQKVNFLQLVSMPKQAHKVGTAQQQQLSLGRVQQVTTAPGQAATQNATLVQRVVTSQVRPQVQTVRQQLQQSHKRNQGATTLSIQQAGKPVTIIPHGGAVLTANPKVSTSVSGQTYSQLMANSNKVLTQLVQQAGQNAPSQQLARIITQPAVTSLQQQQAKQQQQVAAAAAAAGQNVTQAIIIQEEPSPTTVPNTIAATTQQAVTTASSLTVVAQPQPKQLVVTTTAAGAVVAAAATATPATSAPPSLPTTITIKEEEVTEEVGEAGEDQGSSKDSPAVRTSPYTMRRRKPSQSGSQ
ncbi:helicase domino-like isoform X3 [Apostichopus japonicus]|uniref:helicase domino-like isoform X3 n=1 Tax=Stichopus japonicus TaxID=307972 RepID=UPI003AB2551C